MPDIVKIASFTAAHPSPKDSTKTVPAKFKDETGRDFAIVKELADFVETHQGQMVEIEFQSVINGKWTNRLLTAVRLTTQQPATNGANNGGGWSKSLAEAARICRQNALTNTIAFFQLPPIERERFRSVLQEFAAWNIDGIVPPADGGPKAQLARVDPEEDDESPPPWVGIAS